MNHTISTMDDRKHPTRGKGNRMLSAAAPAMLAIAVVLAVALPAQRELSRTRSEGETAWREIARIHAARMDAASIALASSRGMHPRQGPGVARWTSARNALARARAAGSDETLLHDPEAINAWKRYQGELTAALFMLVTQEADIARPPGEPGQPGLQTLGQLRTALLRDEAALAQARLRYGQASAEYAAITHTMAGTMVASLLDYPELPATL